MYTFEERKSFGYCFKTLDLRNSWTHVLYKIFVERIFNALSKLWANTDTVQFEFYTRDLACRIHMHHLPCQIEFEDTVCQWGLFLFVIFVTLSSWHCQKHFFGVCLFDRAFEPVSLSLFDFICWYKNKVAKRKFLQTQNNELRHQEDCCAPMKYFFVSTGEITMIL